jgi:hypothetical protein
MIRRVWRTIFKAQSNFFLAELQGQAVHQVLLLEDCNVKDDESAAKGEISQSLRESLLALVLPEAATHVPATPPIMAPMMP